MNKAFFCSSWINIPMNGNIPSCLMSSIGSFIVGSVACSRNLSLFPLFWMMTIPSTYLLQILIGFSAALIALFPKSYMNRLATLGLAGEPMAAPPTCSQNLPGEGIGCSLNIIVVEQHWFGKSYVNQLNLFFRTFNIHDSLNTEINENEKHTPVHHASWQACHKPPDNIPFRNQ